MIRIGYGIFQEVDNEMFENYTVQLRYIKIKKPLFVGLLKDIQ